MATANPAMSEAVYRRAGLAATPTQVMTIQGTVLKTAILVVILLVTAAIHLVPGRCRVPPPSAYGLLIAGSIGGFITALVTIFIPKVSPFTAPDLRRPGGAGPGGDLCRFRDDVPRHRDPGGGLEHRGSGGDALRLRHGHHSGDGEIQDRGGRRHGCRSASCIWWTSSLSLFGIRIPFIHESGPVGIGFSLVVVVIAALNLILDFDFIEQGVKQQAPKYMEWYGGFSLLVTLVWMYLEILRLLAKLRGSRD